MPFEIAPQVEVSPAVSVADAILRGCALTHPYTGTMLIEFNGQQYACALGAAMVGGCDGHHVFKVRDAYAKRYGTSIERDNDHNGYTREQIAERVRCL